MNNLLSYFGLLDAIVSASEKDLPVRAKTKARKEILLYLLCFFTKRKREKGKQQQ